MTSDFALPSFFFPRLIILNNLSTSIMTPPRKPQRGRVCSSSSGGEPPPRRREAPEQVRGGGGHCKGCRWCCGATAERFARGGIGVACSLAIIYPRAFSGRGTVACVGWMLDLVAQPSHAPEVTESCTASGGPRLGSYNEPGALQGRRGGGPG